MIAEDAGLVFRQPRLSKKFIPRMRDVAARCGVSESTVSHVINGTKAVALATREKVERVLQEMNFHRDSHARRLARGHSDFLGLIILRKA